MEKKNDTTILSVKNLHVYFKSHGKDSHVIRGINLDIKKGECFAIVGESGSGKSVFTKTFTGMLESNGKIKQGSIILNDVEVNDPKIVHRRFADIHRQDKRVLKAKKNSSTLALKHSLEKSEEAYSNKASKYQEEISLCTNAGYQKNASSIEEIKYKKECDYQNLYFADHLNNAYNKISNCMIKQSRVSNRISQRVDKMVSDKVISNYDKKIKEVNSLFDKELRANEEVQKLESIVSKLNSELSKFADFTPGQNITLKQLYKIQKKLVSIKKRAYFKALSTVIKAQYDAFQRPIEVSSDHKFDRVQDFIQTLTDMCLDFAYDALEVKKEILTMRMRKLRCQRDAKFEDLEKNYKQKLETISHIEVENDPKVISRRHVLEKKLEELEKAHQEQDQKIKEKYQKLEETYVKINKPVLQSSTLEDDILTFKPQWVKKQVAIKSKLDELRVKKDELEKKIASVVEESIRYLDNGEVEKSLELADSIGFASTYYKKRIKRILKVYKDHIEQIENSIKALSDADKEKVQTQKHLLEVEKEAAISTKESDLLQVNRDLKNALSIYSSADNKEMGKLLDKEHNIINEVNIIRVIYRKIRSTLRIKKPMVKALRDKGIIRNKSVNLAKFSTNRQWSMIRGSHIATIFQDPMTSLNPLIKIGSQITDVLRMHHNLTKSEAKKEAISLLAKVHIPNPEERFNDYPYQYSGGMRQRVVIAIALACRPDILICDEPTTALDVTVQAQILELIKELQEEYKFTTIFITHDLGVVAGVADRVGVMYGGQLVEIGTDEDVFYHPAHPYTWALLSSLPQLAVENEPLTFIRGNPPVFTREIEGDSFAPRSDYAMRIDYMIEPPMFKISETHYAKTWLLDKRAPKVNKPAIIRNLSKRMEETAKSFLSSSNDLGGGN